VTNFVFVQRVTGPNNRRVAFHDKVLEDGPDITIDQDAYTVGLERVYNVKGLSNMHTEIENTGGANGLTYTIEKARKEFIDITTLVDADFDEAILADTNVAFGTTDIQDTVDISPETTAIRIRVRRETSGMDTTMTGIVSVN